MAVLLAFAGLLGCVWAESRSGRVETAGFQIELHSERLPSVDVMDVRSISLASFRRHDFVVVKRDASDEGTPSHPGVLILSGGLTADGVAPAKDLVVVRFDAESGILQLQRTAAKADPVVVVLQLLRHLESDQELKHRFAQGLTVTTDGLPSKLTLYPVLGPALVVHDGGVGFGADWIADVAGAFGIEPRRR